MNRYARVSGALAMAGCLITAGGQAQGQRIGEGASFATSPDECMAARQTAQRYVAARPADLYKFAHQGAFGAEHAVPDREGARTWLQRETARLRIESTVSRPIEPLFEPLTAEGNLVRVHLRPWLALGFDFGVLLDAFVRTANEHIGSTEELLQTWACFEALTSEGTLQVSRAELRAYLQKQQAAGWPAVHHSETYRVAYAPAYRVVRRSYLLDAFRGLAP